jgi:hypothetical protein
MKRARFTEEQIVTILREANERPAPGVASGTRSVRKRSIGWQKHFETLEATDVERLRS